MNYPKYVQLYPTLKCNQRCTFCFNNILDANFYKDMNLKDTCVLVDILAKKGVTEIDVLGGEPLLLPWIIDFISYATGLKIKINISTNGSLPDIINHLTKLSPDFLNVGFSIHGFAETHNSLTLSDNFKKAIKGIENMRASGRNPVVKSTLMKKNFHEIHDLVIYLKSLGITKYYLMYEDFIGRKKSRDSFCFPEFWKFYMSLKSVMARQVDIGFVAASGFSPPDDQVACRCSAGTHKIAIMPDGSVYPCNLFAGFREFCLGNIFLDDIEKILRSPVLNYYRKYDGINRCERTTCEHYIRCRGGCPAHSYFFCSSLDGADPRCQE